MLSERPPPVLNLLTEYLAMYPKGRIVMPAPNRGSPIGRRLPSFCGNGANSAVSIVERDHLGYKMTRFVRVKE